MPLDRQHVASLEWRSWIYPPQLVRNVIGLPEKEEEEEEEEEEQQEGGRL
jgi:hypothetical protein